MRHGVKLSLAIGIRFNVTPTLVIFPILTTILTDKVIC
jgi:hypothetical protein